MIHPGSADSWNDASDAHQGVRGEANGVVSWGPLAPDDGVLGLLGSVAGMRVLDAGCGGGQNSVALARQGARVTGVDFSVRQLDHARALAQAEGVDVTLEQGDIATLDRRALGEFEVVIAVQVMQYVEDAQQALCVLAGVLAGNGRLILSIDHPVRDLFFDEEEQSLGVVPVADYHAQGVARWRFAGTDATMTTYHRTVAEWVGLLAECGLSLAQLLEPPVPAELLDELWPEDDALAPLRLIPHTLMLVAEKR